MKKIKTLILVAVISLSASLSCAIEAGASELINIKQIGFGNINIPENISNDEFRIKAIYFKLKEESDRIKKVKIDYTGKDKNINDCIISGTIDKYDLVYNWLEPNAIAFDKEVWKRYHEWKNDKGEKKTMTITGYTSEPKGYPGEFYSRGHVNAKLNLVSTKTGKVLVSYNAFEIEDNEIEAFGKIVKEFYKKINKEMKESKKLFNG